VVAGRAGDVFVPGQNRVVEQQLAKFGLLQINSHKVCIAERRRFIAGPNSLRRQAKREAVGKGANVAFFHHVADST